MESVDGTSIHTDRLACTWKVDTKRKYSIKEGGGSEIRESKKKGKITVVSRIDFVIKLKKKKHKTIPLRPLPRMIFFIINLPSYIFFSFKPIF